jgi:hypothetical protein
MHSNGILHCNLSPNNTLFHMAHGWQQLDIYIFVIRGLLFKVDSPCTSKYNYGTVEKMNKNKAKQL